MAKKSKQSLCVKLVPVSEAFLCEIGLGEFFFCVYMIAESLEACETG